RQLFDMPSMRLSYTSTRPWRWQLSSAFMFIWKLQSFQPCHTSALSSVSGLENGSRGAFVSSISTCLENTAEQPSSSKHSQAKLAASLFNCPATSQFDRVAMSMPIYLESHCGCRIPSPWHGQTQSLSHPPAYKISAPILYLL